MKKDRVILAIDTSTSNLSMSLYKAGQIFHYENFSEDHSENLIKILDLLLKKSNSKLQDLTEIAANIGPGSFTGLRVGLSFVKTLSIYLNLEVFTTTSFNILLSQIIGELNNGKYKIITLFPSVKNEFYFCNFSITNMTIKNNKVGYMKIDEFEKFITKYKISNKNVSILSPQFSDIQKITKSFKHLKKLDFSSKFIISMIIDSKFNTLVEKKSSKNIYPLYVRHTYY